MRFFATALLLACGSPDTTSVPPITSGPGRILGTISTFGEGELLHVVPGARVSAAGIEATADQYGRFAIEGVPTDMPIAVTVRGPDAERYADNRIIVNVPSESGAISADFHLLAACEAGFDGTIGGSIGCDDRAAIEFTPGSVDSASVIATIAALDPVHVVDRLGFPGSDEQVSVMGGISVELHDGNDGRPLELEMPVNVRFELAAGEGEVELQWFDGESWIAQPNGTIAIEGERRFYRFEAAHFSSYRAVVTRRYPPNACITFDTAICAQPGCERTVWVSMVDLINQRVTRGY